MSWQSPVDVERCVMRRETPQTGCRPGERRGRGGGCGEGGGTGELGGVMLVTRDRAAQCRINGKPARKVRDCCTAERIDATDAGIKSMG